MKCGWGARGGLLPPSIPLFFFLSVRRSLVRARACARSVHVRFPPDLTHPSSSVRDATADGWVGGTKGTGAWALPPARTKREVAGAFFFARVRVFFSLPSHTWAPGRARFPRLPFTPEVKLTWRPLCWLPRGAGENAQGFRRGAPGGRLFLPTLSLTRAAGRGRFSVATPAPTRGERPRMGTSLSESVRLSPSDLVRGWRAA